MDKTLSVVHVQKNKFSAGKSASKLHNAFLGEGINSTLLSMVYDINDTDRMLTTGKSSRFIARVDEMINAFITRKQNKQYGLYTFPVFGTNITGLDQVRKSDIIYLNWVQGGFINLNGYRRIARMGKPVIIVMHDMWTITGGCHHSFDCEKYKTRCHDCPVFGGRELLDFASREFDKKQRLFSDFSNLYFVSPSRWLLSCARQSALTRQKPVFQIPNIVNNRIFKPINKKVARELLNIDPDGEIIAFGAMEITSPYKGWAQLQKVFEILRDKPGSDKLSVLICGRGINKSVADAIPFRKYFMGFLYDELSMAAVYNAADVFVSPSLVDNLPTTILESLSCGTPVTGFNVGGIPDMIRHRENGYLAGYKDVEDMAEGIRYCIDNKLKGTILPEFETGNILNAHLDLIKSVLK